MSKHPPVDISAVGLIDWLLGAGNYVEIRVAGRSVLQREPLSSFEQRLDPSQFVRISRSVIVRRTCVREVRAIGHGYHLVVCDERSFRVGRKYRAALAILKS